MKEGWRLGVIGVLFIGMLTVLGVRLWYVQVAKGPEYQADAENMLVGVRELPAPRGPIVDNVGNVLVTSEFSPGIVVDRKLIPADIEDSVVQQLSGLLGVSATEIWAAFGDAGSGGTVQLGTVDTDTAYYVWEHQAELPGVTIDEVPVRVYPEGSLTGHIVGYTGKPSKEQLAANTDLNSNDIIGKGGIEATYDSWLQGTPGADYYQTNAHGRIVQELLRVPAVTGDTVHLNVNLDTQRILETALTDAIDLANNIKHKDGTWNGLATKAAGVVLDARTGAVLALGSIPEFDPALLHQISGSELTALVDSGEFSYTDLAISGQYSPASTFKAITYLTAVQDNVYPEGANGPNDKIECSAQLKEKFTDGSSQVYKNWTYPRDDGLQDLHRAFVRSCNIYFWEVALKIWGEYKGTDKENIIQDWARALGLGAVTGIDLPGEQDGLVPDRDLFEHYKQLQLADPSLGLLSQDRLESVSPWYGGDLLNMAVGQGELLATPLQMAVAYAALTNGGTVWQPRVANRITDLNRDVVWSNDPAAIRDLDLPASVVQMLRDDMRKVVTEGTAASAFKPMGDMAARVGGKTGTAQMPKVCVPKGSDPCAELRKADVTSWFVGVAPIDDPQYVVAIMVEEGGGGSQVAAPAVRYVLQYLLGQTPTELIAGDRTEY